MFFLKFAASRKIVSYEARRKRDKIEDLLKSTIKKNHFEFCFSNYEHILVLCYSNLLKFVIKLKILCLNYCGLLTQLIIFVILELFWRNRFVTMLICLTQSELWLEESSKMLGILLRA